MEQSENKNENKNEEIKCNHLDDLLGQQIKVIERHIDKHKWYKGISNKEEAIRDFVDKYAWIMREAFCDLCPQSKDCEPYHNYLKKQQQNGK